jgi:hypothetical protein
MNYLDIIAPAITIIAVACYISQIITRLKRELATVTAQRDRLAEALQDLIESCNCIDSVDFMPVSMPEAFEKAQQALQSLTLNVPHHPRQPGSEAGNKSTL